MIKISLLNLKNNHLIKFQAEILKLIWVNWIRNWNIAMDQNQVKFYKLC